MENQDLMSETMNKLVGVLNRIWDGYVDGDEISDELLEAKRIVLSSPVPFTEAFNYPEDY